MRLPKPYGQTSPPAAPFVYAHCLEAGRLADVDNPLDMHRRDPFAGDAAASCTNPDQGQPQAEAFAA